LTEYSSLLVHFLGALENARGGPAFVFCFAAFSPRPRGLLGKSLAASPPKARGVARTLAILSSSLPNPKSQPFSRSFKSTLPTSLTHIILWTRGCSPWGPDAVMGTIRDGTFSFFSSFLRRSIRTNERTNERRSARRSAAARPVFRTLLARFFFFFVRSFVLSFFRPASVVCCCRCFWASFNFHASIEPVQTFHETRNALPTFPSLISNQAEVNVYVQFFARQN